MTSAQIRSFHFRSGISVSRSRRRFGGPHPFLVLFQLLSRAPFFFFNGFYLLVGQCHFSKDFRLGRHPSVDFNGQSKAAPEIAPEKGGTMNDGRVRE